MLIRTPAIFRAAISKHAAQWNPVLVKEGHGSIVEDISVP